MARGNEGKNIFGDDDDRLFFLNTLESLLQEASYLLYAWCLMDNHYHLLIRVNEFPLGIFMRRLNGRYGGYFRRKTKTRGYFFQDRYKSIVSQDQNYIEEMVRYIHLNPVRAGICKTIEDLDTYRWCGHAVLIGKRKWAAQTTGDVLRCFAKEKKDAVTGYRRFLKEGIKHEPEITEIIRKNNEDRENIHQTGCWVIGNREFVLKALAADNDRRIRVAAYAQQKITLDQISEKICKEYTLKPEEMKRRGKNDVRSKARKIFAAISNRTYQFPVCEVARYLGISPQSASNLVKEGELLNEKDEIVIN
jgi:REP element-mobilizing transposase RayT